MFVSEDSSAREMIAWLRGASKHQIVAVCLRIEKCTDFEFEVYGTKNEILEQLRGVPKKRIWDAIDSIFPSSDEDPEDLCDECDDDEESEQEEETDEDYGSED